MRLVYGEKKVLSKVTGAFTKSRTKKRNNNWTRTQDLPISSQIFPKNIFIYKILNEKGEQKESTESRQRLKHRK